MNKLIVGLVLIVAGLYSLSQAQERPSYEQVLGAVAIADDADCQMLLNLTDEVGECYYTFSNKGGVESALKRYAKHYELQAQVNKVYDALWISIGDEIIMVRKSDVFDVYVVLICQ